ncbi:hypothetical protein [Catenovulum sediminis]|uniref:Outer membrane protein beta-barrel domain-containing protein n=1 Tax=Catenovulum sediminis TaxID=1740262 RepID=A0ABV1RCF7_9ALTE|nr:hypothetical protein [Catenovulum sediminis]
MYKFVSFFTLLFFSVTSSAQVILEDKTIYLSVLEGLEGKQRHYVAGIQFPNRKNLGYLEVGVLDSLNTETEFNGFITLGAGYNWNLYHHKYYDFYLGGGAIAAFQGKCNQNTVDIQKREFCADDKNKDGVYGDTDLLLYPELRLTFNMTKSFVIELNARKYFSVNKDFTPDNAFVGVSFTFEL